nr:hypothetical protein JYM95_18285 [Salmonella enterica subsp. enterica serovar Give var. 15 str. CFSAN004343]
MKTLESNINLQDLGEWRILINACSTNGCNRCCKRVARFPSDKEYVIYISTPIPDNEQVSYGTSNVKEAFLKKITKNTPTFL